MSLRAKSEFTRKSCLREMPEMIDILILGLSSGLSFVADLWNNENTKMKMQTKAILKTTICFFLFFSMFILFIFV